MKWRILVVALVLLAAFLASLLMHAHEEEATGLDRVTLAQSPSESTAELGSPGWAAASSRTPIESQGMDPLPQAVIRVVDELTGARIAVAQIWVRADARAISVGETNSKGELQLPREARAFETLFVRAENYALAAISIPNPQTEITEIFLEREATISGRVQLPNGDLPGPGIRVVAWRLGNVGEAEIALQALGSDPTVFTTTTNEESEFIVSGLSSGESYYLTAAGLGFFPKDDRLRTTSGVHDVTIVVCPAYAAEIAIFDVVTQLPIHCAAEQYDSGPTVHHSDSGVTQHAINAFAATLAGVYLPPSGVTAGHHFLIFTTDQLRDVIGPITFSSQPPGYDPVSLTFGLTPLSGGVVGLKSMTRESGGGFGDIVVQLKGLGVPGEGDHPIAMFQALLHMHGSQREFQYCFPAGADTHRFTGIPAGDYRVSLSMSYGTLQIPGTGQPAIVTTIVPERETPLTLDLGQTGGLRIDLRDSGGKPYERPVQVQISNSTGKRPSFANIAHHPTRLGGLPTGTYSIQIRWIDLPALIVSPAQTVEVRSGEDVLISFSEP